MKYWLYNKQYIASLCFWSVFKHFKFWMFHILLFYHKNLKIVIIPINQNELHIYFISVLLIKINLFDFYFIGQKLKFSFFNFFMSLNKLYYFINHRKMLYKYKLEHSNSLLLCMYLNYKYKYYWNIETLIKANYYNYLWIFNIILYSIKLIFINK